MRLADVLRQSDLGDDDEATIYVERPWSPDAEAIVLSLAPQATTPVEREGRQFDYFLEAFIARDFLDDLEASGEAKTMSEIERCERIIRYAEADA